ncbi:MAG: hypothetical protein ACI4R8_04615 [Candidatus Caccovivens sp.]
MKERFIEYLKERGYKEYTPNGRPSTIYSYIKGIERVISWEGLESWSDIKYNIDKLCEIYGEGGPKEKLGRQSNNTIICALLRFREFLVFRLYEDLKKQS